MAVVAAHLQNRSIADTVKPVAALAAQRVVIARMGHRRRPAWDEYARAHPDGTCFHLTAWLESVRDVFGHEQHCLMAWRGGRLIGVFPLFLVRSRLGGAMLVSVPYAVAGGILADDEAARSALWTEGLKLANDAGVGVIDVRCASTRAGPLPYSRGSDSPLPYSRGSDIPLPSGRDLDGWRLIEPAEHVTFRRELPAAVEHVAGWLPRKARAAARNGEEKHGLVAEFGRHLLPIVWRLYCRSMRRLGSISYPYDFFDQLVGRFSRDAHVQIVRRGAQVVGGLVSFRHGETFLPYFAGCDERYNHWQTNNVLYLAAMRRAVEIGCRVFDFGRTRVDNRGSYDFKRFHGFTPTPLAYQRWVRGEKAAAALTPNAAKFRLARRIWPLLPQAVCVRLSAVLARHIPG